MLKGVKQNMEAYLQYFVLLLNNYVYESHLD
jgi:hypothetical protein